MWDCSQAVYIYNSTTVRNCDNAYGLDMWEGVCIIMMFTSICMHISRVSVWEHSRNSITTIVKP